MSDTKVNSANVFIGICWMIAMFGLPIVTGLQYGAVAGWAVFAALVLITAAK